MKPPTTGYGMNRMRFARPKVPSATKATPHRTVTTRLAATTVTKARSMLPNAVTATVAETVASTTAVAGCSPPTTPREPASQAKIPSVSAAAPRYRLMPSAMKSSTRPPNTRAANAIAKIASTAPMISPIVIQASHRPACRCSATVPSPDGGL